jgi:hypothetical protein
MIPADRRQRGDAVHVERGLGEGAQVELLRGPRVVRPCALTGQRGAGGQLTPAGELGGCRSDDPFAQRFVEHAVVGDEGVKRANEGMGGV